MCVMRPSLCHVLLLLGTVEVAVGDTSHGGKRICDTRCTSDSRVTGGCRPSSIPRCPRVPPDQPAAVIGHREAFEKMIRSKGSRVERREGTSTPTRHTTDDYC